MQKNKKHLFIPDTQVRPGVPLSHLEWIGQYILDKRPDVVVQIGDWYDLPSMSAWDRGKTSEKFQGRRYERDVRTGHDALDLMERPINEYNRMRARNKKAQYLPDKHYLLGNHENRIDRYIETSGELEGLVGSFQFHDHFRSRGWKTHDFLEIVDLDGVWYSHYFYNPLTGNPWTGMIETRLKNIGHTFSQGHTQTLIHGIRYVGDKQQHGLVAGAAYLHDEDYKGPQGNHHWRGVIVKHEVREGQYDIMTVSLNYLCREYEGVDLDKFMQKIYPVAA